MKASIFYSLALSLSCEHDPKGFWQGVLLHIEGLPQLETSFTQAVCAALSCSTRLEGEQLQQDSNSVEGRDAQEAETLSHHDSCCLTEQQP